MTQLSPGQHLESLKDGFLHYLDLEVRLEQFPGEGILSDTVIGEKKLRAGAKLLIPYRQPHMDPKTFGATAASFDPERFQRDKALARNPSYRPSMFVAMVLWRFDIKVAEGDKETKNSSFPEPEDRNPPIGVMGPIRGARRLD